MEDRKKRKEQKWLKLQKKKQQAQEIINNSSHQLYLLRLEQVMLQKKFLETFKGPQGLTKGFKEY